MSERNSQGFFQRVSEWFIGNRNLLRNKLRELIQDPKMRINSINREDLLNGLMDLFQDRSQLINKYVQCSHRNIFLIQVNQILRRFGPPKKDSSFIQKDLKKIFQNFKIKERVQNCQQFILNLTQQWTNSFGHLNQNSKEQLFDKLRNLQNRTKLYLENISLKKLQTINLQYYVSKTDYQTIQVLIYKQQSYLQAKQRILKELLAKKIISQKIINQDYNAIKNLNFKDDQNNFQLVQLYFYFFDQSDKTEDGEGLKFEKMKYQKIEKIEDFKGKLKGIKVKLFLKIGLYLSQVPQFKKVQNFTLLKDIKKDIAQKLKVQQHRIQIFLAKNEENQKELDNDFICSYQNFQQTLCPSLTISLKSQLQFYGFNKNHELKSDQFNFFIEDEYSQKQLISACNKSQNEPGVNFTNWLCKFFYNSIKKGFNFMHVIERFKQHINESIGSSSIWDKQSSKQKSSLNSLFILFYMLSNSDRKLKINIMRIISRFSPIPILLRQFQSINNISSSFKKNQQIKYVLKEGITITSIGFQKNKPGLKGKSQFLSKIFFIEENNYQKRHPICQKCPLLYLRIFGDKYKINLIDVPSQTNQEILDQILKATNILIIQTREAQIDVEEFKQQLRRKGFKETIYIFMKDQPVKLTKNNVQIGNGKITYLPNLKNSQITHMNYFYLRDSFYTEIKSHEVEINNKKIFQFFKQIKLSNFRHVLDQIDMKNIFELIKLGQFSQYLNNNHLTSEEVQNLVQNALKTGLHPIVKKIFQFFIKAQDDQIEIYSHLFKEKLKDLKIEAMKTFDMICLYKKKSELLTDSTSEQSKTQLEQMRRQLSNKRLGNLNKINFQYQNRSIQQIQKFLSQKITQFQEKVQPKIFSYQLAWRQIISLLRLKQMKKERFQDFQQNLIRIKKHQIKNGIPFEIIDGDLLEMPKLLLDQVFNTNSKVCVISILGPQSSGKSTLLNFLFGCDFTASEGRCTRGVYGTYFQLNKNQASRCKYQSILLLDTQGIMANTSQIDQKKRKNFDSILVLFCLVVSDVVLINTKGNIDKNTSELLQLCKQKLVDMKNQQKTLPLYFLIQNMNLTSNMNEHNADINKLKGLFDLKNSKSLSYGYQTVHIKNKQVNLLNINEQIIKKIPKQQFRQDTLILLILIFSTLNKSQINYRNIQQILKDLQRQWVTIYNFPSLFQIKTKEAQSIQIQIVRFKKQSFQKLKTLKMKLIDEFKKKKIIQSQIESQIDNQYGKLNIQILKKYSAQIKSKVSGFSQKDSINLINNEYQKLQSQLKGKQNQLKKDIQQITISNTYQIYKRQGFQCLKKIAQQIKNKIYKDNFNYSQQQKIQIFQKEFSIFIQNLVEKINIPIQINELIDRIICLYKGAVEASSLLIYGLPKIGQGDKNWSIQHQQLSKHQYKNKLSFIMFFGQTVQNIIFVKRSKRPHINILKGGLVDPKLKYFDMTAYFELKQKKSAVCIQKRQVERLFNKAKIENDFYLFQEVKTKEVKFFLNQKIHNIVQIIQNFVFSNTNYKFVGITSFQNLYKEKKLFLNNFVEVRNYRNKMLFKNKTFGDKIINKVTEYSSFYLQSNIKQQQIFDMSFKQSFLQCDLQKNPHLIFRLIDFNKVQKLIFEQKKIMFQLTEIDKKTSPILNQQLNDLHLKVPSILKLLYSDVFKKHDFQNNYQNNIYFESYSSSNQCKQYKKFSQIRQIVGKIQRSEIFVQNSVNKIYQKKIGNQEPSQNHWTHIIGYYVKKQFVVKQTHERIRRQFFNKYISQNTGEVTRALKEDNMTDFIKKELFQNKKFQLLLDQIFRIIEQNIQNLSQERQDVIYTIHNKISSEINEFNFDLLQVSQQLDENFIGFAHVYAIFIILRLHFEKFKKQKLGIVDLFKSTKNFQKDLFLKRCSNDQKQEIQAEVQSFKLYYIQQVSKSIKQKKRNFILQNSKIFKEKYNRKTIQDLVDINVFGSSTYTQLKIQQYIQNPYNVLIAEFKKQQQAFFNQIKDSFKQKFFNQVSQYSSNLIFQAKEVLSFLLNIYQIQQDNAQADDFIRFENKNQMIESQNKNIQDQEKSIFFKYFLDILLSNVQQTYISQRCRGIVRKLRKFQNRKCQLNNNNRLVLQSIKNNPNSDLSIKNICIFLHIMVNKFQQNINQFSSELELIQKDFQDFRLRTQVKFCQEKCPCCKRICGIQHNPSIFEPHQCIFGHQIRGFAKITLNNGYASVRRCQQMKQNWKIKYNNKILQWKEFKAITKDKGPKSWIYDDCLEENEYKQNQKHDLFALAWRVYGKKFCQKISIKYQSFQQVVQKSKQNNIHYILALDESGSMGGQRWNSLIRCLNAIFQTLSTSNNIKVSIITFNQNANIHQQYVPISRVNTDILMRSGGTNFQSPFQIAGDIIQRYIRNQPISFIFMTDGDAQYPANGVQRIRNLQQASMHQIKYASIAFGSQIEILQTISRNLNGTNRQANNYNELLQAYQREMQILNDQANFVESDLNSNQNSYSDSEEFQNID